MPAALNFESFGTRSLSAEFESASATEILQWAFDQFGHSGGDRDQFSRGRIWSRFIRLWLPDYPLPVFTIDTGLLFQETLELKARLERFFGIVIESLVPERTVEQQAQEIGPELWVQQSRSLLHVAQG